MSEIHPPVGAHAVGSRHRHRPWWLWLLLALAALALLLLLLSRCGSDAPGASPWNPTRVLSAPTPSPTPTPTPTSSAPPAVSPSLGASGTNPPGSTAGVTPEGTSSTTSRESAAGAGASSLTADDEPLLPLLGSAPGGDLSAYAGRAVKATGVVVQSVPADEGFWVGNSTTDRVWVQLVGKAGESPYQVKTGAHVTFTGTLVSHAPSFAHTIGLGVERGAAQLTEQKNHIEVDKNAVTIS